MDLDEAVRLARDLRIEAYFTRPSSQSLHDSFTLLTKPVGAFVFGLYDHRAPVQSVTFA